MQKNIISSYSSNTVKALLLMSAICTSLNSYASTSSDVFMGTHQKSGIFIKGAMMYSDVHMDVEGTLFGITTEPAVRLERHKFGFTEEFGYRLILDGHLFVSPSFSFSYLNSYLNRDENQTTLIPTDVIVNLIYNFTYGGRVRMGLVTNYINLYLIVGYDGINFSYAAGGLNTVHEDEYEPGVGFGLAFNVNKSISVVCEYYQNTFELSNDIDLSLGAFPIANATVDSSNIKQFILGMEYRF